MAQVRVTLIFKGPDSGWTETYYDVGANNPGAALANALLPAGLVTKRVALLANFYSLYAIRCSDDLIQRDSQSAFFTQPFNGDLIDALPEFVSLTVQLRSGDFNRRSLYLRGIPQSILSTDGSTYVVTPEFDGKFRAFLSFLTNANSSYGMKVLMAANPKSGIFSGTRVPGNDYQWSFETINDIGATGGDIIRIRGGKKGNDLKGYAKCLQGGNPFKVEYSKWRAGPLTAGTTAQKVGYVLAAFDAGQIVDINHRDTGRFLYGHRGRRPVS